MTPVRIERWGCFGKLPVSREFIVEGSRELAESRFDRWIGEGLGAAKARLGARFDSVFSSFPSYDFLWCGGGGSRALAGRIAPSEDGAGRKHPFSVFAVLDARRAAGSFPLVPLALRGVYDGVSRLLESARAAAMPGDVQACVRGFPNDAAIASGDTELGAAYGRFVGSTTTASLWDAFGADRPAPLRYTVMQGLAETLPLARGRDGRDLRVGLQFPLSHSNGIEAPLLASFWLDLVARRLGGSIERATAFWSASGGGGFDPVLFVLPADPSPSHWVCLVDRDSQSETLSALDRPYGSEPPERRMDPALRSVLDSPASTLDAYRRWASGSRS